MLKHNKEQNIKFLKAYKASNYSRLSIANHRLIEKTFKANWTKSEHHGTRNQYSILNPKSLRNRLNLILKV